MKKLIIAFVITICLITLANTIYAQTILIPSGSNWKYLDNGSNQGTAWRSVTFNDASWLSGPAQLGYGDGDEATVVSYGPNAAAKYITTYFRKTFSLSNPASFSGYTILLKRDDGAAVYVNGTRVIKTNIISPYTYSTPATNTISGTGESTFITYAISNAVFIAGTNVIAVEVHQRSITDVDISFDLKLQATPATCITPGALSASNVTSSSATLNWGAVAGASGYNINYRLVGASSWLTATSNTTSVNVSALTPNSNYEFSVQTNCGSSVSSFSGTSTFTTLSNPCLTTSGLNATNVTTNGAILNWSAVSGAAGYNIQYRISGAVSWIILSSATNSISLTGLQSSTAYEYNVQTNCGSSQSIYSATANFTTLAAIAITDTLIQANASWKYLDTGTLPLGLWKNLVYNETGWNTGNSELGYGDGDETTVVSYGPSSTNKYITTYFRKTISTSNASAYTTVNLNVVRDDGIIVYINGTEVYRNNMPTGTISNSTLATVAIGGTDETNWNFAAIPTSVLINGNNIIAVEIHQAAITSSDISFKTLLTGFTGSSLTRGPYLQMLKTNGITLRWRSNIATNSNVDFGTSVSYGSSVIDTTSTTEHIVTLANLLPQTKYFYRIGSSTQVLQGDINNYFVTATTTGDSAPLRIWVTGDFGDGGTGQIAVRDAFATYAATTPANLWLWLGDNAYNSGTDAEYQSNVFNVYPNQFKNIPVYPSLGNHDYANIGYQSTSALGTAFPYFNIFTVPQAGEAGGLASGTEKYYSYNNANIHFIVLDSYGSYNTPGSLMYNWLQNDLIANTQRWTIVYFHHPPFTKGTHDSDTGVESIPLRQNIVPLFDTYHVDLVLSGHSHDNERSYLMHNHYGIATTFTASMKVSTATNTFTKSPPYEGTIYAVCGTSGRAPGTVQAGWPMPCMYFSNSTNNCSMVIDINGDVMDAKFLTSLGTIADQFTITKNNIRIANENTIADFNVVTDQNNQSIVVSFNLDKKELVEVKIYDVLGRISNDPVKESMLEKGYHEINMKAKMKSGIYFIQLKRGSKIETMKIFIGS